MDDEEVNFHLLSEYFSTSKVKTSYASSGFEAIDLCKKEYFDMIFLDIYMPQMNGYQVCKEIRLTNKETPIIGISGNPAFTNHNFAVEAGCDLLLEKPVAEDVLLSVAKQYIQNF